jgi:hypothetical protein
LAALNVILQFCYRDAAVPSASAYFFQVYIQKPDGKSMSEEAPNRRFGFVQTYDHL